MNSPAQVADSFIGIGKTKTSLKISRMLVLAVLAGAFIALAGIGSTIAAVSIGQPSVAKLVSAAVFPAGLAMVVVAGSELFTGNCLIVVSVLDRAVKLRRMLLNLIIVYIGNLAGALLIAAGVVYSHTLSLFSGAAAQSVVSIASAKTALTFGDALLRGILCNFLVCIAVWMAAASKSVGGKIAAVFFPIFLFVVCGFEHSVANMYYIPAGIFAAAEYGIAADGLNMVSFLVRNLLPVTLGNIIGGCFVGVSYWFIYLKNKD